MVELGGNAAGTGYDQAAVTGTVSLAGANLDLALINGFDPDTGDSFTILANDGTDAIGGTFAGLAQGATFLAGDQRFQISYTGGDGNDVVLTAIAMPGVRVLEGNTLVITGTAGNDVVQLSRKGGALQRLPPTSCRGGAMPFHATAIKNVRFALGDGDDVASVASNVRLPVFMDGGAGNDVLVGGSGHDVLMGGDGDDMVWGGSGHDVLVGGSGRDGLHGELGRDVLIGGLDIDMLQGGQGDDLLLGGATAFDDDPTALGAVRAEWTSGRSYAARIRNLTEGSARRLNGNTFLNATTVTDDGQADVLWGGLGRDWFWNLASDLMLDRAMNERSQA